MTNNFCKVIYYSTYVQEMNSFYSIKIRSLQAFVLRINKKRYKTSSLARQMNTVQASLLKLSLSFGIGHTP